MRRHNCTIREFRNITHPPSLDGVKYRLQVEVIPQEKINQPDEKRYQETYQIDIGCVRTLQATWDFNDNDLEKVLYEYARRHFIEQFSRVELSKSSKLDLHTGNTPSECPYDPKKIQYSVGDVFEVEVTPKMGF